RRRRLLDRLLQAAGAGRDRVEGARQLAEQLALDLGDRDDLGRGPVDVLEEVDQLRVRLRQRLHDRRQVLEERVEGGDRLVDRRAAARERVAEALQRRTRAVARLLVEGREQVLVLDRPRLGLRQRDGRAGLQRLLRLAGRDVQVLEAERRLRPDADG